MAGSLPYTVDDVRRELKGKDLVCWCRLGAPCHADVLLAAANFSESKLPSGVYGSERSAETGPDCPPQDTAADSGGGIISVNALGIVAYSSLDGENRSDFL
jgi:uncharacterized protein DUF4326